MSSLSEVMDFDHPVTIHPDGSVTDGPTGVYAPDMLDDALDSEHWTLLSGHTGQYGYNGPTMHASEFIGGGLEEYLLETPGTYVVIVSYASPETDEELADVETDGYPIAGWAIARLNEDN